MKRLFALALVPLMVMAMTTFIQADSHGGGDKAEKEAKKEGKKEGKKEEKKGDKAEKKAEPKVAKVGEKAPDFKLKNANGKEVKLSDFKGKIVVIEWINLDCPWVVPHYANDTHTKFQQSVRDDGGVWLMICSSAAGEQGHFAGDALKERLKRHGIHKDSYLIDEPGDVARTYQARVTPEIFVICKEGKLRYKGALDNLPAQRRQQAEPVNYVKQVIEALKKGKDVETPERRAYG
jgi:peroxiredoxin